MSISRQPAVVGLVLWIAAVLVVPGPLLVRLFLVVPFVLVPTLAPALAVAGRPSQARVAPLAAWPWLSVAAGVGGSASLMVRADLGGVLLTLPWLLLTGAGAMGGLTRMRAERTWAPTIEGLGRVTAELFLFIGAVSFTLGRAGLDLGFGRTIVELTAIHFSVAGFALVAVAALLQGQGPGASRFAVGGLALGMPLTALGFVFESPIAGWPGALVVGASGLLVAFDLARLRHGSAMTRWTSRVAAAALAGGMLLGIGWATAAALAVPFVGLDVMVRTHGLLNLVGVLGAAVALTRTPAPIQDERRPTEAIVGAGVALAIGVVPATVLLALRSDAADPLVVAVFVGAAIGGWWTPGSRWARRGRVARVLAMAFMAVLAASATVSTAIALASPQLVVPAVLITVPVLTALGMVLLGWAGMLAAVPCAAVWTWVMDGRGASAQPRDAGRVG